MGEGREGARAENNIHVGLQRLGWGGEGGGQEGKTIPMSDCFLYISSVFRFAS